MSTVALPVQATTPTARRLALADQDLLALIFSNLLPEHPMDLPREEVVTGRKHLRDASLVCKAFKDPALDGLWAYLDSLLPLIKLLPGLTLMHGQYYFSGALPKDSKFCCYAKRLRSLEVKVPKPPEQRHNIAPSLFHFVTQELGSDLLLPNLRRIALHPPCDETCDVDFTAQLPWVLSPSIQIAAFRGPGVVRTLFRELCLPLAKRKLKGLLDLSLKTTEPIFADLLEEITEIDTLESLEFQSPATNKSLQHAVATRARSVLPHLRSLSLDLHCILQTHQPSMDDLLLKVLPRLTTFNFVSCMGDRVCPCMPVSLAERITSLTLTLSADITWGGYFNTTAESLRQISSLKSLTLSEKPNCHVRILEAKALAPVVSLSIEELHVNLSSVSWPFVAAGTAIVSAALSRRSVPLRSVTFPRDHYAQPLVLSNLSEIATLPTLERLTTGICSRTQTQLNIFTWGFPDVPGLLRHWKSQPSSKSVLRHLSICEKRPLEEFNTYQYNDIAQLLDIMFPRLESISPYCESDREAPYWKEHWWFIEHLRKMYKRMRLLEGGSSGSS